MSCIQNPQLCLDLVGVCGQASDRCAIIISASAYHLNITACLPACLPAYGLPSCLHVYITGHVHFHKPVVTHEIILAKSWQNLPRETCLKLSAHLKLNAKLSSSTNEGLYLSELKAGNSSNWRGLVQFLLTIQFRISLDSCA